MSEQTKIQRVSAAIGVALFGVVVLAVVLVLVATLVRLAVWIWP
jgi:hypothetical protein